LIIKQKVLSENSRLIYYKRGSANDQLTQEDLQHALYNVFDRLDKKSNVLVIPPDYTRKHSQAGLITGFVYQYYKKHLKTILPAIGTHTPMTENEIENMFGPLPRTLFRVHNWRKDLKTWGEVSTDFIKEISENRVAFSWPAQTNCMLAEGNFDLILSIGQVVPHEVSGMANYNKNILVGTGGKDSIHKSHFLGAVYGMERIMGRLENPVRELLNYAANKYLKDLPIIYILTVIGKDNYGKEVIRGLFIGDDIECFHLAANLSFQVNIEVLDKPLKKVVVYLDPTEYKSTWLGNKSIYRTRMAIADGGELIVLAPGIKSFGEDKALDQLIRKYGYRTTPEILDMVSKNKDLQNDLSAAAHLIHGSSENRFKIIYCPGYLSKEEIESVNYHFGDLKEKLKIYNPHDLNDGLNENANGELFFFISNPALGLWTIREKFTEK
jgi:nickel-dependent lactate racemase